MEQQGKEEEGKITVNGSEIIISGTDAGTHVEVCNIDGTQVFSGNAHSVAVPIGIYVVRVTRKS